MKKIILFAFVLSMGVFASCKKDYTCECKQTIAGVEFSESKELGKQKKKDAEEACDAINATFKLGGGSCVLEEK